VRELKLVTQQMINFRRQRNDEMKQQMILVIECDAALTSKHFETMNDFSRDICELIFSLS
jgi:hypothetical protein